MNSGNEYHLVIPAQPKANTAWMLSLADLLSLVLTFFVMLYAMTVIPTASWQRVVVSMQERLNPTNFIIQPIASDQEAIETERKDEAMHLDYIEELLMHKLSDMKLLSVHFTRLPDRLILSLPGELLFAPGNAILQDDAVLPVAILANNLRFITNPIEVEGHTDPDAVSINSPYASNWALSLARANTIADHLQQRGYNRPLHITGRADSIFAEFSRDLPKQARYTLSRRVDIIIRAEGNSPEQTR